MIKVSQVTKAYDRGEKPAIENISFQVEAGQIHGLIGPNAVSYTHLTLPTIA